MLFALPIENYDLLKGKNLLRFVFFGQPKLFAVFT